MRESGPGEVMEGVDPTAWLLRRSERGNPSTSLYRDAADDEAWTAGNDVLPLVDGASYFRRLVAELRALGEGDQAYFVDWRGDPDERLDGPGTAVMVEFGRACSAGATVFGLVWRSHLDHLRFSQAENRNLSQALQAINAPVMLDQRIRRGGSHHQKFVVLRHPREPERDMAFVGGIDLGHGRRDDRNHGGDPQAQTLPAWYGRTPPWHDAMLEIRGPAVADVEACFRERWLDPESLEHARPWIWVQDRIRGLRMAHVPLPSPLPRPPPAGPCVVQLLRTYPAKSSPYPFAPHGERTVARGYVKALSRAQQLIYIEDQFLWSATVAGFFADALRRASHLHLVAVLPRHPDSEGGVQEPAKNATHRAAIDTLEAAAPGRVHLFDLENASGTPIYVHAKVCLIDDAWAAVGSANLNRRSWSHDSELTAAVVAAGSETLSRRLRLQLWSEHLGRDPAAPLDDLDDMRSAVAVMDDSAAALDRWHDSGRQGPRPRGHLRRHIRPVVATLERAATGPLVRLVIDPDGRPRAMRRARIW
jgi:phosphatidylserine/phosphatidylglycerophosphate/cardiolipin synthase-like enzyme